jgi:hypothetical protein
MFHPRVERGPPAYIATIQIFLADVRHAMQDFIHSERKINRRHLNRLLVHRYSWDPLPKVEPTKQKPRDEPALNKLSESK